MAIQREQASCLILSIRTRPKHRNSSARLMVDVIHEGAIMPTSWTRRRTGALKIHYSESLERR